MLTHIRIRNFKRFDDVGFDLGSNVVFIGPNNSGKTTALQALALWDLGVKRWIEKRQGKQPSERRIGVAINRRDLISIPVPDANLLWRDLHVRNINRDNGSQRTQNVRIDIIVQGVTDDKSWECGLEFDYANEESLYCRPLRLEEKTQPARMEVPAAAGSMRIAYLPPMSGLAAVEPKAEQGRINVLIGEGQTAQVLRNLCYQVYEKRKTDQGWHRITQNLKKLFGVTLLEPIYIQERGEILMSYEEAGGLKLDLSSSGRGLQQTLLLLAYLYANPRTVLLLDEPDAHLEILRQRQIYQLLTETAQQQGSQVIAASHSEVVLNEAASRDIVIAFVGKPHRMGDRSSQILKALTDLGFDQYYQAEQTGWVLYLEGSTDLAILYAFAEKLNHSAKKDLERAFVHYVSTNTPQRARDHFYGLLEAKPDLIGYALFDRLDKNLATNTVLVEQMWQRKEIENYLCHEETLMAYAQGDGASDLFSSAEMERRLTAMRESIKEVADALSVIGKPSPWSPDIKASDDFLKPVFQRYFVKLDLPNLIEKSDYHQLARYIRPDQIDPEVVRKLEELHAVAERARPRSS